MRHERQPRNAIRVTLEIIGGGVGQTGLSPTFVLQRLSDGAWWDALGGTWEAAAVVNALPELDATNFPGVYEYALPAAGHVEPDGREGYRFQVVETVTSTRETGIIHPGAVVGGELQEMVDDHFDPGTPGSLADAIQRMLGLRQSNMRFIPATWDANTAQPTSGMVYLYKSKTDLLSDTAPWSGAYASYSVAASFDPDTGQLQSYTSVRES